MKREELLEHLEMWYKLDKLALDSNITIPFTKIKHKNCSRAYKEIVALIKKPGVTEEWIDEKAERFLLNFPGTYTYQHQGQLRIVKDFIRKLMEDVSIMVDKEE